MPTMLTRPITTTIVRFLTQFILAKNIQLLHMLDQH